MVKQNSVLRFFFDTLNSKLKVKYRILDNNMKVVEESSDKHGYESNDAVY